MQCGAAQDYRHKTALHGASGKNRAAESADDRVCARYEKLDRKLFRTKNQAPGKGQDPCKENEEIMIKDEIRSRWRVLDYSIT